MTTFVKIALQYFLAIAIQILRKNGEPGKKNVQKDVTCYPFNFLLSTLINVLHYSITNVVFLSVYNFGFQASQVIIKSAL